MPTKTSPTGSELFIVDNSDDDWKVVRYLHDWCQLSKRIDVATGYFEIGALLALKGEWQKVDEIRILLGDDVSLRTRSAFERGLAGMAQTLDASIEAEKEKNDFLQGVPAIVDGIRSGKIKCRVYRKDKFHAKAYITHARLDVEGSAALVGSSNLTFPGITQNIELNVQITGRPVRVLQEWYEEHWDRAEDVTAEVLRVVERHVAEHPPFDVYARSLLALLEDDEVTAGEWERRHSAIYPLLAQYQRNAYGTLLKRGGLHGGAFLCDGVGLGKTYVGLGLIERLVEHDRKRVALFVPKAAVDAVWRTALERHLPDLIHGGEGFKLFSHTDLTRSGDIQKELDFVRRRYDAVVIDEAHHFRNLGTKGDKPGQRRSRYWRMHDLCEDKEVYLLTATPVNNRLTDFQHMAELFTRNEPDHFAHLGVHSLAGPHPQARPRSCGHSTAYDEEIDVREARGRSCQDDPLFQSNSSSSAAARTSSESLRGDRARRASSPNACRRALGEYKLRKIVYGRLLDKIEQGVRGRRSRSSR